jgi:hypothetical protein
MSLGSHSEGMYQTTGLDFATYLIEMGVPLVRTAYVAPVMTYYFKGTKETLERHETHWLSRTKVEMDPRSFIETRQTLVARIQDRRR